MGYPSVTQAVGFLTAKELRAARGYPNAPMPHIIGLAVAVVVHKSEPDAVTHKAIVCVPKRLGMEASENGASLVSSIWSQHGGACTWGEGKFDQDMDAYIMEVYGRWEYPVVGE